MKQPFGVYSSRFDIRMWYRRKGESKWDVSRKKGKIRGDRHVFVKEDESKLLNHTDQTNHWIFRGFTSSSAHPINEGEDY